MAQTVQQALQQARLYSDNVLYSLVHLPPNGITAAAGIIAEIGEPFAALIADKDEVTLVIPADSIADFASRLRDHRVSETHYRLITFDVELEPTLTGFIARVSEALAAARIPILTFAAFSRDHLLVPADRFGAAWAALQKLQAG
jgi:hypothetical protein